jgi:GTP-binding protein HflX
MLEGAGSAERAFLVGVDLQGASHRWHLEDSLRELAQLARTAGMEVVGQTTQNLSAINAATYIGSGKVSELETWRRDLEFGTVIFDDELSPSQQRNLERALEEQVKVIDRTALILDIFAQHARTREGALQVALAQYEYRLPRLTRAWTHLARQAGGSAGRGGAGGGVGLRGPGETQLEIDRQQIRRRISDLKEQLEDVRTQRRLHRERRRQDGIPTVALVGYTNAGKSTLLNRLSDAGVLVEDKLFATLDPTTRRIAMPAGRQVLISDTVGFIQKLPTNLVAAFRATLEEVTEADALVHVLDASHPNVRQQATAVSDVLGDLGASDKPLLLALNKVDLVRDEELLAALKNDFPSAVLISAARGEGIESLLTELDTLLMQDMRLVQLLVPYAANDLVALFHKRGIVEQEEYREGGTWLRGRIPSRLLPAFVPYQRPDRAK